MKKSVKKLAESIFSGKKKPSKRLVEAASKAKKILDKMSGLKEDSGYDEFFKKKLEATGKSIPDMSDEEKKTFFDDVDSEWNSSSENGEDGEVDEAFNWSSAGHNINAMLKTKTGDKFHASGPAKAARDAALKAAYKAGNYGSNADYSRFQA